MWLACLQFQPRRRTGRADPGLWEVEGASPDHKKGVYSLYQGENLIQQKDSAGYYSWAGR